MRFMAIPNTDLVPSVLCLGTSGAGATYDRATTFAMLDVFFEQGGNFVDTAHIYNDWIPGERSRSEKLLGAWIQERRNRPRVLLATKGGHPHLAQMQARRLSPAEICADLEESLRFLQVETIDLYWLHRDDPTRPVEEIIDTLEAQGVTGFVGVQNLWTVLHRG